MFTVACNECVLIDRIALKIYMILKPESKLCSRHGS